MAGATGTVGVLDVRSLSGVVARYPQLLHSSQPQDAL